MSRLEGFLQSIAENPTDDSLWLILADWLDEQEDPRGELVRLQYALRQADPVPERDAKEERLQALLAEGVRPCLPRLANSIGMEFVLIPPGSFLMGSLASEKGRMADEGPRHPVTLTRPFYLGTYPVNQHEYQAITGTTPSCFGPLTKGGPEHPVEQVSWTDASRFCESLSRRPTEARAGRVYRLPTEAEWEYACRAGTSTPFSFGTCATSTQANFDGSLPYGSAPQGPFLKHTTPVGTYPPNPFGLYDMHGNVWEWCATRGGKYTSRKAVRDPQGPKTGRSRVMRGGYWGQSGKGCRSATRSSWGEARTNSGVGFRVAVNVASQTR